MRICDRRAVILTSALLAGGLVLGAQSTWRHATPDYEWSFPHDHWAHREHKIEWWYLTGHLQDSEDPARRFGYQFTIFRIGLVPGGPVLESDWSAGSLLMGHAALTDVAAGEHRFSELLYRESPLLAGFGKPGDSCIAWTRAPAGTDDEWELCWNGEAFDLHMRDDRRGFALDLQTTPLKPRVFQGPGGFSRKSEAEGAASHYYSFTRLATTGSITIGERTLEVGGRSWMDQEFSSSQLTGDQVGWDWFSLQLDDGRDLMLFEIRDRTGRVDHGRGTLVESDGTARYLALGAWATTVRNSWTSRDSGIAYPSGWTVELAGEPERWIVEPLVRAQENRSALAAGPSYWEGAVAVLDERGNRIGSGYVELTGYGENNRPPL